MPRNCPALILFFAPFEKSQDWIITLSYVLNAISFSVKICATEKNSAECKKIEASRNEVKCVSVTDSVDCIFKIQKGEVDFGTFTPEEALLATNFLEGKADVIAEIRNSDRLDHEFAFQTVVVVKANYTGGLGALTNSAYCHPGFSRSQYWTDQVLKVSLLQFDFNDQLSIITNLHFLSILNEKF